MGTVSGTEDRVHCQAESECRIAVFELRHFLTEFGEALRGLIGYLAEGPLRNSGYWGRLVPFGVVAGNNGQRSLGHCLRVDMILTENGPTVYGLDVVSKERGVIVAALSKREQIRFIEPFTAWYAAMGTSSVVCATATDSDCSDETAEFAAALRSISNIEASAANIDRIDVGSALVDRCFRYREVRKPQNLYGKRVVTAETYLDSTMILALVHDPEMEAALTRYLGVDSLLFLRRAFALTLPLRPLRKRNPMLLEEIAQDWKSWVLKNGDVEVRDASGGRGVALGPEYTMAAFHRGLFEERSVRWSMLGSRPVVQRFCGSVNFGKLWNAMISGQTAWISSPDLLVSRKSDTHSIGLARRHVYARLSAYILLDNIRGSVTIPPYGLVSLRQNEFVHPADAQKEALGSLPVLQGLFRLA